MSLTNVAYNASFGWADPSTRSLEAQIAVPMFNEHPIELGIAGHEAEIVAAVRHAAPTSHGFAAAFPADAHPVSLENIVRAIAAFERTLLSADSPFDRYLYRDDRTRHQRSGGPRHEAVLLGACRLQRLPRRLQPLGPGDVQLRAAPRRSASPTPASTTWTARARIRRPTTA